MPTFLSANSRTWLNLFYSMSQIVGTSVIMFAFHLDEVFAGEIFIIFFVLKFLYLLFTNYIVIDKIEISVHSKVIHVYDIYLRIFFDNCAQEHLNSHDLMILILSCTIQLGALMTTMVYNSITTSHYLSIPLLKL